MIKKLIVSLLILVTLVTGFLVKPVSAANDVNIYFFWGNGCPHCAKEEIFLDELKKEFPSVKVHAYEVWYEKKNQELMNRVASKLGINITGVPFTVVGDQPFTGFAEGVTDTAIRTRVLEGLNTNLPDSIAEIVGITPAKPAVFPQPAPATSVQPEQPKEEVKAASDKATNSAIPEKVRFPFVGEVRTKNFSLPLLTVVFGILDGFNPCAMWTLLFLISLLIGMKDRKRMWILGSSFIITSAVIYFLFMAAWLNLMIFIGVIYWVRTLIGLVAIGGGSYNLKEYLKSDKSGCKVTNEKQQERIFDRLKMLTQEKKFWLALVGIIVVASAVNLVELLCSAGLPAIYTHVLTLSNLATWQYYAYLLLYIFFYMLDDLIIFFIAMFTLQMTGITTRYTRYSHLIGGILMVIIGLLLIFKPSLLMFG